MLLLKRSTSRRDKPKRSRSALSRLPDSWLDDNINLVLRTPKVGYVTANYPCGNKHFELVTKTGMTGIEPVSPVGNPTCGPACHLAVHGCIYPMVAADRQRPVTIQDSPQIVVAIPDHPALQVESLRANIPDRASERSSALETTCLVQPGVR